MRVLYVIHGLPVGGAENIVVNYIIKLKEKGLDVHLLELYHFETFLYNKIQSKDIPCYTLVKSNLIERFINRFFPFYFILRFNRIVNRIKPDVIHFQTVYRFTERISFPIKRSVFTFHARVERCFSFAPFVRPLLERLSVKGLHFVAISSKVKADILQFLPAANTVEIPNGIDLYEIKKQYQDKMVVRKELGISDDSFVIGQVGRFNIVKNHLFTLDVFKIIVQRNSNSYLLLIGDGNEEEKTKIFKKIKENNLEENVKLLGIRENAIQLMCGFDVLIHPSLSESFSLVLVEAQANGIRCVASDEIPPEVICNDNCFQLSLSEPIERWADVIMGEEKKKMVSNLKQFDLETVISKHISLYESLVVNDNS